MFLLQGANKVNCYSDQLKLGQVCKIRVELYNYTLGKDSKIKLIISAEYAAKGYLSPLPHPPSWMIINFF